MPEGKSIYDVAFGAGSETGKYGAELLETEDIWERMAHKGESTDWKIERDTSMANVAMDTLGLASEVYGGFAAKKEFEGVLADTSARAGEAAYTKSETARVLKDEGTEAIEWSALDPSKQAEWTGKFEPEQKEQKWYESLFGKEAEYKFGESDYFKQSSISASHALSEATSLEGLINAEDLADKPKTMADEVDLSEEAKESPKEKVVDEKAAEEEVVDEEVVSPGTPDKDEFEYTASGRAGSREWFEKQIKQFKQRNQRPEISGPATGYNVQLEKLARDQGWTGSGWE